MKLKEPIVEGAWYLLEDNFMAGQAIRRADTETFTICGFHYHGDARPALGSPRKIRQVHLVPTDPAEVVEILRTLRRLAAERSIESRSKLWAAEDKGQMEAYNAAADLVESMLGLARCGQGCDGNCELTASGPTKAEAELAELRAKTAEVIAELKAEVADLARHNRNEYTRDRSEALTHAADLVAEKLGVK